MHADAFLGGVKPFVYIRLRLIYRASRWVMNAR